MQGVRGAGMCEHSGRKISTKRVGGSICEHGRRKDRSGNAG
jgi:hypothetical protein